MYNVHIRVNST